MKKRRWAALFGAILLGALTAFPLSSYGITAKGVVVIERETGRVLFAQNGEERLPMASTTKIMTALIALEQPNLDAYFVVDPEAIRVEGSSMGLREGDQVTLRGLAYGMLLSSGNDAANAAAVRIAGSEEAFVGRMNARAREMGLLNLHFATPSGLDGEGHYASAHDMAVLAQNALENPDFAAICGAYRAQVEYGNPPYTRWLKNHNKLLDIYEGTVGVKTGFTKEAGRCLVSAAHRDGVGLICVTLGASDDWNVHMQLYDQFFESLQLRALEASLPQEMASVVGGVSDWAPVVLEELPQAPLTQEERTRVERRIELDPFLYAPVEEGARVGWAIDLLDGQEICRTPIVADASVAAVQPPPKEGIFEKIMGWITGK